MKKIIPLVLLLIACTTASAQLFKKKDIAIEPQYQVGMVPVDNTGRVSFNETIQAPGLSKEQITEKVESWFKNRFVKPTIIGAKRYDSTVPGKLEAKIEEYLVFTNKLFVLNRSRIKYILTITCEEETCNLNISRITYWHDDEDPNGGLKYQAEELITDDIAFNKDKSKLKKYNGKFRCKTIDLKNTFVEELKKRLTEK
ncbi:MAG: DUF4468 domain-containing protein [Bacteroidaceae bacterium]|nr:DUF4468 domain-containing protein [Bacteroidaceae bacterium]